jgi:hypothetical protein
MRVGYTSVPRPLCDLLKLLTDETMIQSGSSVNDGNEHPRFRPINCVEGEFDDSQSADDLPDPSLFI